jgi:2-polyprenyl-3-methyl-5-hydroxy-6-metoxy-1,4-benzoquinol methylase
MANLSKRSFQLEMLDMPVNDKRELRQNLGEISRINKLLGGDQVTLKGLKKLMIDRERTYRIVDIGCGDGGLLRHVYKWANKNRYSVDILGIDIDPDAIHWAREKSIGYTNLHYQAIGYEAYFQGIQQKPDIVISALFCHHLEDKQLEGFLKKMADNSKIGFIINDLHRHFLAYYSIKWLTAIFSRSRLTKNDAPVSVLRGFRKKELISHFQALPTLSYEISWQWAFRYLVVASRNGMTAENHEK